MIVDDTLKYECLLQAGQEFFAAAQEERSARERFSGYSWGYYGRDLIDAKDRAAGEFRDRLRELIRAEVKAVIGGWDGDADRPPKPAADCSD